MKPFNLFSLGGVSNRDLSNSQAEAVRTNFNFTVFLIHSHYGQVMLQKEAAPLAGVQKSGQTQTGDRDSAQWTYNMSKK